MSFTERLEQEKLLYEAFKGIKYRNFDEQRGLEASFLTQFTDTAIHMIISQMIDNGVRVVTPKDTYPICEHDTFENEYGDMQCNSCRKVLPFDCIEK